MSSTTRAALSQGDLRRLVRGETVDERAAAAHKLCRRIDEAAPAGEDRRIAQEILRVMAADPAEPVRRAVAVTLRESFVPPRDVALKLARDVESVATPILANSPVFTDEDLIEIIRYAGPVRQMAIATRSSLTERVTSVLAEHGAEVAVRVACINDNAIFSEAGLQRTVSRFASSQPLLGSIACRRTLPPSVAERLVNMVSERMRDHLINHHALPPETALQIAVGARERATIDLVDQAGRATDMEHFVERLQAEGQLTASFLLRALAHGHMTFFEWAVSALAKAPHHRTWLMIHDAGALGLRAIYERAGLPTRLFAAFQAGVEAYRSMEFDGGPRDQQRFQQRMLERFLTQPTPTPHAELDYLLGKLERRPDGRKKSARRLAKAV